MRKALPLLSTILLVTSTPTSGQLGPLEGLFDDLTHISLTASCWNVKRVSPLSAESLDNCHLRHGFGVRLRRTLGVAHAQRAKPSEGPDTTTQYFRDTYFETYEIELGYSQFTGLQATVPGLELRGEFRELPSFSGYWKPTVVLMGEDACAASGSAVRCKRNSAPWAPVTIGGALGLHTGLVSASDLRAWMPATDQSGALLGGTQQDVFGGTGAAFQIGVSLGVHAQIANLAFGVERQKMIRDLDVAWAGMGPTKAVPGPLPRFFDFGGGSTSLWVAARIADPFTSVP